MKVRGWVHGGGQKNRTEGFHKILHVIVQLASLEARHDFEEAPARAPPAFFFYVKLLVFGLVNLRDCTVAIHPEPHAFVGIRKERVLHRDLELHSRSRAEHPDVVCGRLRRQEGLLPSPRLVEVVIMRAPLDFPPELAESLAGRGEIDRGRQNRKEHRRCLASLLEGREALLLEISEGDKFLLGKLCSVGSFAEARGVRGLLEVITAAKRRDFIAAEARARGPISFRLLPLLLTFLDHDQPNLASPSIQISSEPGDALNNSGHRGRVRLVGRGGRECAKKDDVGGQVRVLVEVVEREQRR